jgi:hypothetical protein
LRSWPKQVQAKKEEEEEEEEEKRELDEQQRKREKERNREEISFSFFSFLFFLPRSTSSSKGRKRATSSTSPLLVCRAEPRKEGKKEREDFVRMAGSGTSRSNLQVLQGKHEDVLERLGFERSLARQMKLPAHSDVGGPGGRGKFFHHCEKQGRAHAAHRCMLAQQLPGLVQQLVVRVRCLEPSTLEHHSHCAQRSLPQRTRPSERGKGGEREEGLIQI